MHPALFNSYVVKEGPSMVAEVTPRSPLELQARTLAATALTEADVDRTDPAMAYLTSKLIEHAAFCAAAWKTANEGDAQLAAKGGKS